MLFQDLLRYSRGECKTSEAEVSAIQEIVKHGLDVEELRDEIYVQCVRQLNGNPCEEQTQRLWLLVCLMVVAFTPSKAFFKVSYRITAVCRSGFLYVVRVRVGMSKVV